MSMNSLKLDWEHFEGRTYKFKATILTPTGEEHAVLTRVDTSEGKRDHVFLPIEEVAEAWRSNGLECIGPYPPFDFWNLPRGFHWPDMHFRMEDGEDVYTVYSFCIGLASDVHYLTEGCFKVSAGSVISEFGRLCDYMFGRP